MVLSSKLTPSKPNYLVLHQQCPKPLFTHVDIVNAAYNVHANCAHQAMNLAAATVHALPVKNVINSAKNIRLNWTEHIPTVTHLLFLSTIKIWMRMQEQKTLIELIKEKKREEIHNGTTCAFWNKILTDSAIRKYHEKDCETHYRGEGF